MNLSSILYSLKSAFLSKEEMTKEEYLSVQSSFKKQFATYILDTPPVLIAFISALVAIFSFLVNSYIPFYATIVEFIKPSRSVAQEKLHMGGMELIFTCLLLLFFIMLFIWLHSLNITKFESRKFKDYENLFYTATDIIRLVGKCILIFIMLIELIPGFKDEYFYISGGNIGWMILLILSICICIFSGWCILLPKGQGRYLYCLSILFVLISGLIISNIVPDLQNNEMIIVLCALFLQYYILWIVLFGTGYLDIICKYKLRKKLKFTKFFKKKDQGKLRDGICRRRPFDHWFLEYVLKGIFTIFIYISFCIFALIGIIDLFQSIG